jgi:hypothetical protein
MGEFGKSNLVKPQIFQARHGPPEAPFPRSQRYCV